MNHGSCDRTKIPDYLDSGKGVRRIHDNCFSLSFLQTLGKVFRCLMCSNRKGQWVKTAQVQARPDLTVSTRYDIDPIGAWSCDTEGSSEVQLIHDVPSFSSLKIERN